MLVSAGPYCERMIDWAVVGLSLAAAFFFAVSTTLKKASASADDGAPEPLSGEDVVAVARTVKHPLWLAGILADVVGLGLQVTALHFGGLTVVQPLLVSGLLFALLLRHRGSTRITRAETAWALTLSACLVGFLVLSGSVSGAQQPAAADRVPAAIAAIVGVVTAVACLMIARRRVPPAGRAALIGVAVGAVYATTAALIKSTTNVLSQHGPVAVLTSWQLYVVVGLGVLGLFLTQLAFRAGPLTASLPAISTVDPLLSVAIGVVVYDEHLRRGPLGGALLAVLLLLLVTSVVGLGRVELAEDAVHPNRHSDESGTTSN